MVGGNWGSHLEVLESALLALSPSQYAEDRFLPSGQQLLSPGTVSPAPSSFLFSTPRTRVTSETYLHHGPVSTFKFTTHTVLNHTLSTLVAKFPPPLSLHSGFICDLDGKL